MNANRSRRFIVASVAVVLTAATLSVATADENNEPERTVNGTPIGTGQSVTPTAAPGSAIHRLNPGLKPIPGVELLPGQDITKFLAGQAETTALSPDGSRKYVAQPDGRTVVVYATASNTPIGSFVTDQTAGPSPRSIAVAPDGTLYITDMDDNKVYAVTVSDQTML